MANPRKFSEKIAMHNQKQAEETAAFDRIMKEVSAATITKVCFNSVNSNYNDIFSVNYYIRINYEMKFLDDSIY